MTDQEQRQRLIAAIKDMHLRLLARYPELNLWIVQQLIETTARALTTDGLQDWLLKMRLTLECPVLTEPVDNPHASTDDRS